MDDAQIRRYQPPDLDSCRGLWEELTQHHREIYDDPSIGGDDSGHYFDEHLARVGPERIWVAERDGEVLGFVGLILEEQGAEVEPVIVASRHRGKGIGRALLSRAVEEARKLGVRYLTVKPVARNVEAISFFHRSGFRTLGHIDLFMDLGQPEPGAWKPGLELFGHSFEY